MMNSKKGISIIAVLLFMLIATIAGTATYRWLSSENRSSASRMFQNEARLAAVAGIESARSWFAHHGNETGAVVKQLASAKKSNKAVKLDNQLVAFKKDKQNYSVYVVDVDESEQPYKIKVVSEGFSRDGTAKYSETAVLKVSGLYRVGLPTKQSPINFDANYFGGSVKLDGRATAESMIVNGNTEGQEISVTRKLVVTGNVSHGSNKVSLADTTCIGGDLINDGDGIWNIGRYLYVHGKTTKFSYAANFTAGDVYFNGDVTINDKGAADIQMNNLTINGNLTQYNTSKNIKVFQDLCLTDDATLTFGLPGGGDKGGFKVEGNVWIPGANALHNSGAGSYKYVALGGNSHSAYIAGMGKCQSGYYYREFTSWGGSGSGFAVNPSRINSQFNGCPADMYYQVSGLTQAAEQGDCLEWTAYDWGSGYPCKRYGEVTFDKYNNYTIFTTEADMQTSLPTTRPFSCAEDAKTFCVDTYLSKTETCEDGTKKLDDMLTTAASTFGDDEKYGTQCVKDVMKKGPVELKSGKGVAALNKCFENNKNKLYNGFLVVKGKANKFSEIFTDVVDGGPLVGKFIFYIDEPEDGKNKVSGKLPPTYNEPGSPKSLVFMYLPNGAGNLTQGGGSSAEYRYFFFSNHDIETIGSEGSGMWTGSIYLLAENCAKLNNLKTGSNQQLIYDPDLIKDLADNSVICNADAVGCGSSTAGSTSGGSSGTSGGESDLDSVRVAVGANLLVELESQYKTTEKVSSFENIEPTVIVMPRVVYVNSDAEGSLTDYFNPVAMNGVGVLGSGTLKCSDSNLESTPLSGLIANTNATCEYSVRDGMNEYKSSFFVMIQGPSAAVPKVGFDGDATVSIDTDTQGEVRTSVDMNIGAVLDGAGQYSLDVVVTGHFDWIESVNLSDNFTLKSSSEKERRYHLTGVVSSSEVTANLFTVKTNSSSGTGNVVFTIENANNCTPVAAIKAITVRGSMKVVRKSLDDYCKLETKDVDLCTEVGSDVYKNTPSCESMISKNFGNAYEWVAAFGDECRSLTPNNMWKCYMGTSIDLVRKNSSTIEEYCDVIIPSTSNSIVTFENNNDQYLYADVKHKKYKLDLHLENRSTGYVTVYYSTTAYATQYDVQQAISNDDMNSIQCRDSHCEIDVYAGYHYYLKGESTDDATFSYWKKPSEISSATLEQVEGNPYHILIKKDEVAYAVFNARDDHCFYDNFDNLGVFCDDNSCPSNSQSCNCIDRCTNYKEVTAHCSVTGGHSYSNANWVMVYANDPQGEGHDCLHLSGCRWRDYFKPIKTDDGLYYTGSAIDGDAQNDGRESVILSYVDAGTNGTLSASYEVANASYFSDMDKKALNSGFILRSNADATKYLILAPYGMNLFGGNTGSWSLYLRVCYVDKSNSNTSNGGKTLTSSSTCSAEQKLEFSYTKTSATASAFNKFNIEATLQGEMLNVAVGLEGIFVNSSLLMKNVSFNLAQSPLKSLYSTSVSDAFADNKYVGFKLADKGFKVHDIAWRSNSEECWDTPYATCSFASNYIGGRVPLKQDVMPWVNTSTWLSNKMDSKNGKKACDITYYYNGCDMNNSRYDYTSLNSIANGVVDYIACGSDNSSTGYYWGDADGGKNGIALNENSKYNFEYEGLHGEPVTSPKAGIVRNASVRITCEGMKRSYVANCGSFWVGPINECTKNETLLPNENPDYASGFEYLVGDLGNDKSLVLDKAVNLRNATLEFKLKDGSGRASVYLKDDKGYLSSAGQINSTTKSISVENLIDEFGFDPENVTEIVFNSEEGFVVTEIKSACASAPSVSCSSVEYSAESGIRLYGTATNADGCKLTVTDAEGSSTVVDGSVVCAQNPIVLSSDAAKALTAGDYKVSLTVTKGDVSETCAPVSMAVNPTPSGEPPLPGYAKSAKSASCTRDDEGVFHITVNGCESNDDCSIKTRRGDYEPEVVCNWVTSGCDVTLYNSGTYDILFYDGSSDRRLAGCSGITVE